MFSGGQAVRKCAKAPAPPQWRTVSMRPSYWTSSTVTREVVGIPVLLARTLAQPPGSSYPSGGRTVSGPRNSTKWSAWRRTTFQPSASRRKTWVTR